MNATIPVPPVNLDASLDDLLALVRRRFEVDFETVVIDDLPLQVLRIANMEQLLDELANQPGNEPIELPFWAKIWPAAVLLGYALRRLPADPTRRVLEIGAGVGLSGLVAAARGFPTLITDIHPDALLFARINILKNDLADHAQVARLDFTASTLTETFDLILGAEVVYQEEVYRPLVKFLLKTLSRRPDAEAVLGLRHGRGGKKFFDLAEREFHIDTRHIGCRTGEDAAAPERHLIAIHRLKPRKV